MATKVVMEALSPTMEEGRLVEWKKNEGDAVAVGDVLAEVETDKAVMELVARAAGTLIKQATPAGTTVPVASVVAWIGDKGEAVPGDAAGPRAPQRSPKQLLRRRSLWRQPPRRRSRSTARAGNARNRGCTDAVQRRCRRPRQGLAARATDGRRQRRRSQRRVGKSGPEGRIIKRDVEEMRRGAGDCTAAWRAVRRGVCRRNAHARCARRSRSDWCSRSGRFRLTTSRPKSTWSARTKRAKHCCCATTRARFSFNDVVIRATAAALRLHPWVNAWWLDDKVRQWHEVHIGVAVAVDEGLDHAGHSQRRPEDAARDRRGSARARRARAREEAQARGIHRRDVLDVEPRHVRHRRIHRDDQSARSGDPRGGRASNRSPWSSTARSSCGAACESR